MSTENIIPKEERRQPLLLEHLVLLSEDKPNILSKNDLRQLQLCSRRLRFLVNSTLKKATLHDFEIPDFLARGWPNTVELLKLEIGVISEAWNPLLDACLPRLKHLHIRDRYTYNRAGLREECQNKKIVQWTLETLHIEQRTNVIPGWIASLTSLKEFSMRGGSPGDIYRFPTWFSNLTALEKLSLSYPQGLPEMPQFIRQFRNLKQLSFPGAYWKSLPDWFGGMPQLESLDLTGYSELKILPNSMAQLTTLTRLELYECKVSVLKSPCLEKLTGLRDVGIWGDYEDEDLPYQMWKMPEWICRQEMLTNLR